VMDQQDDGKIVRVREVAGGTVATDINGGSKPTKKTPLQLIKWNLGEQFVDANCTSTTALLHEFVHVALQIGGQTAEEFVVCRHQNEIRFEQGWKMRVTRGRAPIAGNLNVNALIYDSRRVGG
jgi:hypothetical protein